MWPWLCQLGVITLWKGDVEAIKKVQKRVTKLVISSKNYHRLVHLGLPTLNYRSSHGDMIGGFKITKHKYDYKVAPELNYNINNDK